MSTYADGLFQYGGMPVTGGIPPLMGLNSKVFFVDPVNGADGNSGTSLGDAFATLYRAHYMMTAGRNDVCFLVGDGATTGTARLSLANALAAQGPSETAATTGVLTWSKAACHLIGIGAPTQVNQRARISSASGDTYAGFGSTANFMRITAAGCYFANFALTQGIAIGLDGNITLGITGDQNCFNNVHVGFPSGTSSIAGASTRALVMTGAGENTFLNCTFGMDTVTRSAANSTLEFATGSPRNVFRNCIFSCHSSDAGAFHVLVTGTGLDRYVLFDNCTFFDNEYAGATALTAAVSATTNSAGGGIVMQHCSLVSASTAEWGDTNAKLALRVDGVGGAATAGVMLRPT